MLYALHEMSHAALTPWQLWASFNASAFSHPFSPLPYSPLSRKIAAGSELFVRITQRYQKPEFGIGSTRVGGKDVAVSEVVVLDKPFCQLRHFERNLAGRKGRADPVVLLVAPLSGHHATLLRDTVRTLLPEHEVYVTDWVDARMVPLSQGVFHLDDYVDYVREFITFLGPDVHVISVCQPTVPVLAAISLMAEADAPVKPRTMIMMGGPDRRAAQPDCGQQPGHAQAPFLVQGQRHRPRAGEISGRDAPGVSGFPAAHGLRRDESFAPCQCAPAISTITWSRATAIRPRRTGASTTSTTRCSTCRPSTTSTRSRPCSRSFPCPRDACSCASSWCGRARSARPRCSPSKASSTTSPATARPSRRMDCAPRYRQKMREHYLAPDVGHYGIFSGRRFREIVYPRMREFIRRHG